MTQRGTGLHPSEPDYDLVLEGVSRGLEALFPPIVNPPRQEYDAEDDTPLSEADDDAGDPR